MNILSQLTNIYDKNGEEKGQKHSDRHAEGKKGKRRRRRGKGGKRLQNSVYATATQQQQLQRIKGEERMEEWDSIQQRGQMERRGWREAKRQCCISVAVLCRGTTVLHINY